MSSPFFGLNIGVKALNAAQRALEVISHNIANINTPGQSRQEVVLKTSDPQFLPSLNRSISAGQVGTGVEIEKVRRIHDSYIEKQLKNELQTMGKWEAFHNSIEQIEGIFSEPSENGLRKMMDTYWDSWSELANSPEDHAKRKNLIENSRSLCNFFQSIDQRLEILQNDINTEIGNEVVKINNYAKQLAELNNLIKDISAGGDSPNDLMDQRDTLIRNLCHTVNASTRESDNGQVDIYIGGFALVREGVSYGIETVMDSGTGFYDVIWRDSGIDLNISNGGICSLIEVRDKYITGIKEQLDTLASTLIVQTNSFHMNGFGLDGISTGYNYFSGNGISDIEVNADLINNTGLIAAAALSGKTGDNSNIKNILNLRDEQLFNSGKTDFDSFYNNLMVKIGIDGKQCQRELENTELLINKISLRKESISGISLDEELTNMIRFQHSYNAASKIISVMDEMMEIMMERMGA